MESIEIEVLINKIATVNIPISDVIGCMNEMPMTKRWNYIAQILNNVQLNLSDISNDHQTIIKNYLNNKLKLF